MASTNAPPDATATVNALIPLVAGDLRAVFLPSRGMLAASFQHRGAELLGRTGDIASFAQSGRTCGIPLLYPWANRLNGTRYRAAGTSVELDTASPLLHFDRTLPMHGVPWSLLTWQVIEVGESSVSARLDWTRAELLAVFPFPHLVEMHATLDKNRLTIKTEIHTDASSAVPVSFGFHPYLKLPHAPRAQWRLELPAMNHLELDAQQIPTGRTAPFAAFDDVLGERAFDDGFVLLNQHTAFSIRGSGRRIRIEFLEGYPFVQIYAPREHDYIAIEPMTAPTNALISGQSLRVLNAGETFIANFRIAVEKLP